jgi:hypothetical protein
MAGSPSDDTHAELDHHSSLVPSSSVTPITQNRPAGNIKRKKSAATDASTHGHTYPDETNHSVHRSKKTKADRSRESQQVSVAPSPPPEGQAIVYTNARMLVDTKGNFGKRAVPKHALYLQHFQLSQDLTA